MEKKKKSYPKKPKATLHPRNKHIGNYDFEALIKTLPELKPFVALNKYNTLSVDFFNPEAVKMVNKALLKHFYGIEYWDIPKNYLCPPITGRADYIHHISDLLSRSNDFKVPNGNKIKALDIGVGSNCVYPIIGYKEYGWMFIGSDIDSVSVDSAKKIVNKNDDLIGNITIRLQKNAKNIFRGVINDETFVDAVICNPPFHASLADAREGTIRKLNNLKGQKNSKFELNFGGKSNELSYEGGEERFLKHMIQESSIFADNVLWFSSLVSKESKVKTIYQMLKKYKPAEIKVLPMGQGNKISRVVAWTFQNRDEQKAWAKDRW
jgi:23S rRNA (adenine1618-N6)-methyltransferase